jgi:UDP-N-acetylglucosamine acyltransferase
VEAITHIRRAFKTLYKKGLSFDAARAEIAAQAVSVPELAVLAEFLDQPGRGIIR